MPEQSCQRILTIQEVADLVKVSTKTVMRAIAAGDLEASQLTQERGGWRIYESAIPRWMEAKRNRPRPLANVATAAPASPPRRHRSRRTQPGGRLPVDMGEAA